MSSRFVRGFDFDGTAASTRPRFSADQPKLQGSISFRPTSPSRQNQRVYRQSTWSNHNPLDLIQRDLISRPVVEFGGPGRFVTGDRLRILNRAPMREVGQ